MADRFFEVEFSRRMGEKTSRRNFIFTHISPTRQRSNRIMKYQRYSTRRISDYFSTRRVLRLGKARNPEKCTLASRRRVLRDCGRVCSPYFHLILIHLYLTKVSYATRYFCARVISVLCALRRKHDYLFSYLGKLLDDPTFSSFSCGVNAWLTSGNSS